MFHNELTFNYKIIICLDQTSCINNEFSIRLNRDTLELNVSLYCSCVTSSCIVLFSNRTPASSYIICQQTWLFFDVWKPVSSCSSDQIFRRRLDLDKTRRFTVQNFENVFKKLRLIKNSLRKRFSFNNWYFSFNYWFPRF